MSTSGNRLLTDAQSGLMGAARSWDRFWFKPTEPTTLCFMRICAGCILLYVYIGYSFDLMSYVHPDRSWMDKRAYEFLRYHAPLFPPSNKWTDDPVDMQRRSAYFDALNADNYEEADRLETVLHVKPFAKGQYTWSVFFHLRDERWIWAVHVTVLGCIVLFTIGLWTRLMTMLVWAGALGYIERATNMMFGMDAMIAIALAYLMIGPAGATLSVDRWLEVRRARRLNPNAIVPLQPSIAANIAIRLFQIHFCFIYAASGFSKLQGPMWWNGTALWVCVANYSFAPMTVGPYKWFLHLLCQNRLFWELFMSASVAFTLLLEIGLPFLIWTKRFRWLMVCGAVMLHTGIGLIMGLVGFSMFMMVLVFSFVPPGVVRRQIDFLLNLRKARRPAAPPDPMPGTIRSESLAVAGS